MNQQITSLQNSPITNQQVNRIQKTNNQTDTVQFSEILKNALENVNKLEIESNIKTEQLAMGKEVSLHDIMITAQKAAITVESTVQIQQKVIDRKSTRLNSSHVAISYAVLC